MGTSHVAPHIKNLIKLTTSRRIRVELGDLDKVFDPVNTVKGKKQRLQALGHYYETLSGAAGGNTVTEAYTNCLAYFRHKREKVLGALFPNDGAMEADLQARVREFVLEGNALPAIGGESKIRLPGAFMFSDPADLGDGGIPDGTALPSGRYNDEQQLWVANPTLGCIPLLVTVEKRVGDAWVPSPNDWVHFQLIAPFYDDPEHELDDANALRDHSMQGPAPGIAVAVGPRQFINDAIKHLVDLEDPQRFNAHTSRGGKRGDPVLGNIFAALPSGRFPGMNAPEASPAPRQHAVRVQTNAAGAAGLLFTPSRIGGDRYRIRVFLDPVSGWPSSGTEPFAVAEETGRFAIYKHVLWSKYLPKPAPVFPLLNSIEGVQARLAVLGYDVGKIDNHDGPLTRDAVSAYQANYLLLPPNGKWNDPATQTELEKTISEYINGGGSLYVSGFGPVVSPFDFEVARAQFRQLYCALEIEPTIESNVPPPTLDAAQWGNAFLWARQKAHNAQATYGLNLTRNVNAMFLPNFKTPFLFEICHPKQYNRTRGAGFSAAGTASHFKAYWLDAAIIIYADDGLLDLFLRYLAGAAGPAKPPTGKITPYSTPGMTVVPAMAASRLFWPPQEPGQVQINIGSFMGCNASGVARKERSCAVFGGRDYYKTWVYHPDGYTKNTLHEIGHILYLRHQFTGNIINGIPNWQHAGANFREDHHSTTTVLDPSLIPPPVLYDRCLMGYLHCEGQFCGKCQLKIRGWDISQMPV